MTKKLPVYGVLRVSGASYWLLKPDPVERDSWQLDGQQRWFVAPTSPTGMADNKSPVYGPAMHLVCTGPLIEYREHPSIQVSNIYDLVDEDESIRIEFDYEEME